MEDYKEEMFLEDVGRITAETVEFVSMKLKGYNTRLPENEVIELIEDKLFDDIFERLETFCDNDYKQHN